MQVRDNGDCCPLGRTRVLGVPCCEEKQLEEERLCDSHFQSIAQQVKAGSHTGQDVEFGANVESMEDVGYRISHLACSVSFPM